MRDCRLGARACLSYPRMRARTGIDISGTRPALSSSPSLLLPTRTFESERVKLTPFIPPLHAQEYAAPDLHRAFPFEHSSMDQILTERKTEIELLLRRHPSCILFATIDKACGRTMASMIALINERVVYGKPECGDRLGSRLPRVSTHVERHRHLASVHPRGLRRIQ